VGAQVVHEDDIALVECRRQNLLDIGEECRAIHRAIDDIGSRETIGAQAGDERHRLPVAVRHLGDEALATRTAPVVASHFRRDGRLVDEHETSRLERRLLGFQLRARRGDVRSILLGSVQSFF
jgi:hypothetical protein